MNQPYKSITVARLEKISKRKWSKFAEKYGGFLKDGDTLCKQFIGCISLNDLINNDYDLYNLLDFANLNFKIHDLIIELEAM